MTIYISPYKRPGRYECAFCKKEAEFRAFSTKRGRDKSVPLCKEHANELQNGKINDTAASEKHKLKQYWERFNPF